MTERPKAVAPLAPALLVAAATLLVFARSLGCGFIDFDDPKFLIDNPHFHGLTGANLRWMFGLDWIQWYPLTWLTYTADYALWGLRPAGYHLTSVVLHALNAALAFRLFDRLMRANGAPDAGARRAAAAFGALFFALHPLRVESVAWASERSDVLSAAFGLGAALAWLEDRAGLALALHAAALASKGVAMAVPLVLGLLDALGLSGRPWPGARREARALAPMLALSGAAGFAAAWGQARVGAASSLEQLGPAARLSIASWSYGHGVAKTLWPSGLEGLYPMPHPFRAGEPRFLLAAALVVLTSALAWRLRRRAPAFTAAWGAYLAIMAPTSGLFKVGVQLIADRYTYLAAIGFAGLAAEALRRALAGRRRMPAAAIAVAGVAALAGLTWTRQADWSDSESFWGAMAAADPGNAIARFSLALRRVNDGHLAEAERLLREAERIDPSLGNVQNALANLLASSGRADEAVAHYRAAVAAAPGHPIVRYNLALALASLGRRDEAARALREELALIRSANPDVLRAQLDLEPDEARTRRLLETLERR